MKKFTEVFSPVSWAFASALVIPAFIVVFRPTLVEFLVMTVADSLAHGLIARVDIRWYRRLFPGSVLFFPEPDEEKISQLDSRESQALFRSLVHFPEQRSLYVLLMSFLKLIPAGLVVVFYWKHEISNVMQAVKFLLMEVVIQCYFYGALYIELHQFVSDKIEEFDRKFDWKELFHKIPVSTMKLRFLRQENISLIAIGTFSVFSLILIIGTTPALRDNRSEIILETMTIAALGLLLFGRIYYLNRRYFMSGLQRLFNLFETLDYSQASSLTVPLHSSPVLMRFAQTFNTLGSRLKASETELSLWAMDQVEQNHLRTMGELSGLIVHDLASPLHVIQFCTEQIIEDPAKATTGKYLTQLATNSKRASDLVISLRSYLRNSSSDSQHTDFMKNYEYVTRLLQTQFSSQGFHRVDFRVTSTLEKNELPLMQTELIHILDNLYRNAINNLLKHAIPEPRVHTELTRQADGSYEIRIRDNGTGLSKERFEALTAFQFLASRKPGNSREGLGLRLVRRLIERHEGSLSVEPNPGETGTCFVVRIRDKSGAQ